MPYLKNHHRQPSNQVSARSEKFHACKPLSGCLSENHILFPHQNPTNNPLIPLHPRHALPPPHIQITIHSILQPQPTHPIASTLQTNIRTLHHASFETRGVEIEITGGRVGEVAEEAVGVVQGGGVGVKGGVYGGAGREGEGKWGGGGGV